MYLIFGGERYYGSGGGYDLICKKNKLRAARELAKSFIGKYLILDEDEDGITQYRDIEWAHVVDSSTGEVVCAYGEMPYGTGTRPIRVSEVCE